VWRSVPGEVFERRGEDVATRSRLRSAGEVARIRVY